MKLLIDGKDLYTNQLYFSHVEVNDGIGDKSRNCAVEPRYSHLAGRQLLHAHGLGWIGADDSCAIRIGRVVRGDGSVIPCKLTETRLMGLVAALEDRGEKCSLELIHG